MSKLTPSQHATLVWLEKIGGVCVAYRDKVAHPKYADICRSTNAHPLEASEMNTNQRRKMPAVSALHLVQRGCIEARDGRLRITEYGRRVLRQ